MDNSITKATSQQVDKDEWEEPYGEEPFESPDEWEYLGLLELGDGNIERVWRHNEKKLELMYGMDVNLITVIREHYSEKEDFHLTVDDIEEAAELRDDYTEFDKREVAKEMLQNYA